MEITQIYEKILYNKLDMNAQSAKRESWSVKKEGIE